MRRWKERRRCMGCDGAGYVDPPYGEGTSSAVTCPCCGGTGIQVVDVEED